MSSGPCSSRIIEEIEQLKQQRNAVVLAHNYMTPDIFHGVADLVGDSLQLARLAADTDADVIVMAGVHFMAETAKIVNPDKTVLIPDLKAGCSLAESITAADIRLLRQRVSGRSGRHLRQHLRRGEGGVRHHAARRRNAVEVVESLGVDKVIFLPDQYLGRWVASQTDVEVDPLARQLHGARAVHRRRAPPVPGRLPGRSDHRPPGVPARRARRGGLRRAAPAA